MTTKKKYYVVWAGRTNGIFGDWQSCKEQVIGFEGAKYKSFETEADALHAFEEGYATYYKKHPIISAQRPCSFVSSNDIQPTLDSLSVDAAWNSVSKVMEYRGVHTGTKKLWFHKGPFEGASNNIGEFLALVHGLALLKQLNSTLPIYSDSITAIAWVRHKKHKSIIIPTAENEIVFDLLIRAEDWLNNNTFSTPIVKWDTKRWGEIPADFGRK